MVYYSYNNVEGRSMPRKPREYSSTGIYHVMVRGNERKEIFHENEDRKRFLYILEQKKSKKEYDLYAYCLMDNHAHLIIKENMDHITRIMKRINTSYASYYNKKYGRVGHVFQDRYKSEVIEQESYLLEVIRYVHNNPVKARLVDDPKDYPWSSFHLFLDHSKHKFAIVACDEILGMYGRNKKEQFNL